VVLNSPWFLRNKRLLPLIIIVAVLSLGVANFSFAARAIGGNDFLPPWMAARMWISERVNPYHPSVSVEAQEIIYGRPANVEDGETLALFLYPLWAMLFYVPFSIAPYPLALAIWMTLLELGLPLLIWMGVRLNRWRAPPRILAGMMIFSIFCYHGMRAIVSGQFAIVETILITGALLAIQRRQDILGGALLALSLVKPHLSILLILFVILWAISMRRWRLLVSTVLWPLLFVAFSYLFARDWMLLWLRSLVTLLDSTDVRPPLIQIGWNMGAVGFWTGIGMLVALVVSMVWEWFRALGKDDHWFQWTAGLTLVITSLVNFRTTTADFVLLIPALVLMLKVWLERKKSAGILPALLVAGSMLVGIWVLYIATASQPLENPYLFLPLPLLALIGLFWSRWWTTSGPGVLMHSEKLSWD